MKLYLKEPSHSTVYFHIKAIFYTYYLMYWPAVPVISNFNQNLISCDFLLRLSSLAKINVKSMLSNHHVKQTSWWLRYVIVKVFVARCWTQKNGIKEFPYFSVYTPPTYHQLWSRFWIEKYLIPVFRQIWPCFSRKCHSTNYMLVYYFYRKILRINFYLMS